MNVTGVIGQGIGPEIVQMTVTMVSEDQVEGQGHQGEEGKDLPIKGLLILRFENLFEL